MALAQLEKNESTLSKGNLIRGGLMGYGPEEEGLGYEGSNDGKSRRLRKRLLNDQEKTLS